MIDFTKIRGDAVTAQRDYFEQLVCHLAFLGGGGKLRRIHGPGGDGGVEALRLFLGGQKTGYQAKYYPVAADIDWSALDDSVQTALTQHPDLSRYVIALPCDFTGKRAVRGGGSTEGAWGKWDDRVAKWQALARSCNITVAFECWTAFELETTLLKPEADHLRQFFFDQSIFSRAWIARHADRTLAELQARYSPDEHVDTESLMPFEVVFRRPRVVQDLHKVFETSRSSHPRAAAALVAFVADDAVPASAIVETEKIAMQFDELKTALDGPIDQPWPICAWLDTWHRLTRHLSNLTEAIEGAADGDAQLRARIREMTKVNELIGQEVFGGQWARHLPVDALRAVLFVGRAGAGKSHLLARAAHDARQSGAPLIHILGQHIRDADPRDSILKRLGLADRDFDHVLAALNLAAEAAQTRALLIIDALNEGRGTEVWRHHLAGLVHEVTRHDRIVLVMSCREEYLDYVVPAGLFADPPAYPAQQGISPEQYAPLGKLARAHINGFSNPEEREAALHQFMDLKGIARPTAPALDGELFNPLFMSSVCRAMAKAGMTVFPQGLHATRDMFAFVLHAKAMALGTPHDGSPKVEVALRAALDKLAQHMASARVDHVPLLAARQLVNAEFSGLPLSGRTWLDVLEGADILRRDVEGAVEPASSWSAPNEVVRFAFQRLQDNLIAEHLNRCAGNLDASFGPDAPWGFLIERSCKADKTPLVKPAPRWAGVLGALWALVAHEHGRELCDLASFFAVPECHFFPERLRPVFRASIRERQLTAFSGRTKSIFDWLWEDEPEEKVEIYLAASCIPGHAWNADTLDAALSMLTQEELEAKWSRQFGRDWSALAGIAGQISSWALSVPPMKADAEVVRLARISLKWLSVVGNDKISIPAAKALARVDI